MKSAALACLGILIGTAVPQDDSDAKKKRLGELFKQMNQIQAEAKKLLQELSGGDPEKTDLIMKEIMEKYAPEMAGEMGRARTASNERNASATLKSLATAQADFRANDRDGNQVNDYWVADVSGLYRIDPGDGAIRLIEQAAAMADAQPCVPLDKVGTLPGAAKGHASKLVALGKAAPKAGYWFTTLEKYQDEKGTALKYNDGNGRNPSMFGMCAYPAEYGKTGKFTFLVNEANVVWKKDTAGKAPDVFPFAPDKAGWTKMF